MSVKLEVTLVTSEGVLIFPVEPEELDIAIEKYLPASPMKLRQVIVERTGDSAFAGLTSVTECLFALIMLDRLDVREAGETMGHYFILEHPRKGIMVAVPGDRDDKFHFSFSKPRDEAMVVSLEAARRYQRACPEGTEIRQCQTWKVVY